MELVYTLASYAIVFGVGYAAGILVWDRFNNAPFFCRRAHRWDPHPTRYDKAKCYGCGAEKKRWRP